MNTLTFSPEGDLVVATSRSKSVDVGSLKTAKEVVPSEPTLKAGFKQMGFLSWKAEVLAFGSDGALVTRAGEELALWQWDGALSLIGRAKWEIARKSGIALANFDGPVRITPGALASLVRIAKPPRGDDFPEWKDRVIAIWDRAKFPKARSLEGNAKETRPTRQLPLEAELGDVSFELLPDGGAVIAESLEYQKTALTRWDAKGKRVARVVVELDVTGLASAGAATFVTTGDGELVSFDEKLGEVKRVKAHRERAVSVCASGAMVFTTSAKELSAFEAAGLKPSAKLAVKGLHDFRVQDVTSAGVVLTNNPPGVYELIS